MDHLSQVWLNLI